MTIFLLGALQGAIGWWMVSSGVFTQDRTAVAPERLSIHLGLALLLYVACVMTNEIFVLDSGQRSAETQKEGPTRPGTNTNTVASKLVATSQPH